MNAVIIAVGSELTTGRVVDANQPWLSAQLDKAGIETVLALTVPDSRPLIAGAIARAFELEPDIIVVSGGLGPTEDDMTSAAIATALDLGLTLDPAAANMVAGAVGFEDLEPHQEKQATLPAGSMAVAPAGTAPGFILMPRSIPLVVLPGVPREMREMWERIRSSPPVQAVMDKATVPERSVLCFYGCGEPAVNDAFGTVFADSRVGLDVSICSQRREVRLELSYPVELKSKVADGLARIRTELGEWYYSDGAEVEAVIAELLIRAGKTLAVGESCTGGLLGAVITCIQGSSDFFRGGVTAYHNEIKHKILKVRQQALDVAGAVSEPVAQQLALGARSVLDADYGIGITGIAGPGGGTADKPVGLVFICVSSQAGDIVERFDFTGGRQDVRAAAVTAALHMLRRKLLALSED